MKKLIWTLAVAASAFTACQQSNTQSASANSDSISRQASAGDDKPASDTVAAYHAYLELKDNLVKADHEAAQKSAKKLATPLSNIKGCTEAAEIAQQIAAKADIKAQRNSFLRLSEDMIPLVKGIKNKPSPVYVAYCPMANDGKGGYWLSSKKEIENPYYGADMLECGEVKEEIK